MQEQSAQQESGIRSLTMSILAFMAGALILSSLSLLQKIQLGAPLVLTGFIIPVVFGGALGWVVKWKSHQVNELQQVVDKQIQAEKALQEKERFQQALLDDMHTFVAVLEPDGSVVFVNNTPFKLGGFKLQDVIGQKFYDAPWWTHSDEVHATLKNDIKRCSEGESLVHDVQIQVLDGSLLWIEYSMHPIYDEQGNVQFLVPEGRDINDRKLLEEQYRQAQKMEAVGQLAGGIAHDFNNLLQVIKSYSTLALRHLDEEHPAHQNISNVNKAGDKAAQLVSQILAFSRQQVLDMEDVDINNVVMDVSKMLRRVLGEHVSLQILTGPNLGIVHADSGQIEQILMNLCVNARDAMPDGGTITIETKNSVIDDGFCQINNWAQPGNYALLSVTDTGCGMNEETIKNIFEPFFTTKGVGEGSGLGLSMVYGLVKQHQGLIHLHSEEGKSATFEIYLPLTESHAVSKPKEEEVHAEGGTETILLAEDNLDVLEASKTMLEVGGYTILTATDGEEALRVFEKHRGQIDMLLLDVMMPKLGGRGVYEQVYKSDPQLAFLFASGYSKDAIHTNFILDGGLSLIKKPFMVQELLQAVRTALNASKSAPDQDGEQPVSANILLVDDDDDVRLSFKRLLESAGHVVTEAPEGNSALRLYQQEPADLVITDLVMPEKEGLGLIQELKRDYPDARIIAVSGGGRGDPRNYLDLAKKFGAAISLEKPVNSPDLLEAVNQLMDQGE